MRGSWGEARKRKRPGDTDKGKKNDPSRRPPRANDFSIFIPHFLSLFILRRKRLSNIGRAVWGNAGGARSSRCSCFLIFTPRTLNYASACYAVLSFPRFLAQPRSDGLSSFQGAGRGETLGTRLFLAVSPPKVACVARISVCFYAFAFIYACWCMLVNGAGRTFSAPIRQEPIK